MENNHKKGEYLEILLRSPQTVFSTADVALLWNEKEKAVVSRRLYRYVQAKKLLRLRRGLYAKNKDYSVFEFATKIYTPSYISFETVLARAGIVFQVYAQIFVAARISKELVTGGQKYSFRKIKDTILVDPRGIEMKKGYAIATPERAFLDTVYSHAGYHFDNADSLDWEKVFEIVPLYRNKEMEKRVRNIYTQL